MKRRSVYATILLLLAFVSFGERILIVSALERHYIGYDLSFLTRITNKGSQPFYLASNRLTEPTTFLFTNDTSQVVKLVTSNRKLKIMTDADGNQIGIFEIEEPLHPMQSVTIEVSFRAHLSVTAARKLEWMPELDYAFSGSKKDIPQELLERYCPPSGPWKINDAAPSWLSVRELAYTLARNETNVLRAVMLLVDWVGRNIKYPTIKRDRILLPNETLHQREGDCDEQANLVISMCRILGIPAYLQCGCVYLPAKTEGDSKSDGHFSFRLDRMGWHAWAMVYVPPWGWLPVDMTMGYSSEYPLLAIQGAASQSLSTVVSNNYLATDYVTETNLDAEKLKHMGVYVEEKGSMRPTLISPEYQATAGARVTTSTLIIFGITVIAAYIVVRARAITRRKQMKRKSSEPSK